MSTVSLQPSASDSLSGDAAWASAYARGLPYDEFLDRFATEPQRNNWNEALEAITLTAEQTALLESFPREMHVLVLAGAWCGDCVSQCPIFEAFARVCPKLKIRYVDRNAEPPIAALMTTCGAARVPSVAFLSEDGHLCGRYGDKTLAKYRDLASQLAGDVCSTGFGEPAAMRAAVIAEWLGQFERIEWMLRLSGRLRSLHGD